MLALEDYQNKILCGDAAQVLKTLPDSSIHCTVTSPPYDTLRQYTDGATFNFEGIAQELFRVTTQGGVVVWVVADATINGSETGTSFRQALYFRDVCHFNLHDTMIFVKKNPVPLSRHSRYEQAFEYVFVFSKGKPRVFNGLREPCKCVGRTRKTNGPRFRNHNSDYLSPANTFAPVKADKLKSNIFAYAVGSANGNTGHPAVFPLALARDMVTTWSNTGDTVLDPFSGSGTTLLAATGLGRNYVGIDISSEYVGIANQRLAGLETHKPQANEIALCA